MSKCLRQKAKECDIAASDIKRALEDTLLKELTVRYVDSIPDPKKTDYINDIAIYDLCGYMLKARPSVTECPDCRKTIRCDELELPPNFTADAFTALRTRGNLIFVTVNMFLTFRVIESIIASHFNPIGQIYASDSFQVCIGKISQASILKLFCDEHRDHHLPYLIREYVGVRYHFESVRLKNLMLSQSKKQINTNGKLSKNS
jgi:hypothetical protein